MVKILSALRSPSGTYGGPFRDVPPAHLLAEVYKITVEKSGIDPSNFFEALAGWGIQTSEAPNIARVSWLLAGFPIEIPAMTFQGKNEGGIWALLDGIRKVKFEGKPVLVGAVDVPSTSPYLLKTVRFGVRGGHTVSQDPVEEFLVNYAEWNEYLARDFNREDLDDYAVRSNRKAFTAQRQGKLKEQTVIIRFKKKIPGGETEEVVSEDRTIDPALSPNRAQKAETIFPDGKITKFTLAQKADGAAALVLSTDGGIAEILSYSFSAGRPEEVFEIADRVVDDALKKAGNPNISLVEVEDHSSAIGLWAERKFGKDKVNIYGGLLAYGYTLSASPMMGLVRLIHGLREMGGYGLLVAFGVEGEVFAFVIGSTL
jgi:acetyl-CoA C-acetyltransferase